MIAQRILLLLCFSIFCSAYSFGQIFRKNKVTMSKSAIVHYNDGSIFVGRIIREGTLDMDLLLTTNDTIHLDKTFIHRIKRGDENISLYGGTRFHYTKGVFYSLHLGGNFNTWDAQTNQFELIAGYRFSKNLAAGIGVGASYNATEAFGTFIDTNSIPLFAYGRYYPIDKRIKPFVAGKLGWAFPDNNAFGGDHSGGLLFQPEIGVNFASRKRIRFLVSIGQQLQNIKGDNLNFDGFGNPISSKFNIWFNRTVLKVGIDWK